MNIKKLSWGVKASFRGYVEAVGGSITLGDGATQDPEGAFVFEAVPGGDFSVSSDGKVAGSVQFTGSVTFDAHGGMLKSTLSGLAIEAGADGIFLTVSEAPQNESRCAVAELSLMDADDSESMTFRSTITMDGMYQIADNYPPGTELDPVQLE